MRRLCFIAVVMAAAVLGAAAPGAGAVEPCSRYAATPERVFHGDDFEFVHAAASAMYCPDDVYVQITACVQVKDGGDWADVGCVTSPGTHVTSHTSGGRGQAVSFDVDCVTGLLRTHVTGGEGLEPTVWDSESREVRCIGSGPLDGTPPQTMILTGPTDVTDDPSPTFTFVSSESGSTFACRLDGGVWEGCTSPAQYHALPDGHHVFAVRATDRAGNTDPTPAERAFTLDTSQPPGPGPEPGPTPGPAPSPAPGSGAGGTGTQPPSPTPAGDTHAPAFVFPHAERVIRASRRGVIRFAIGPVDEDSSGMLSLRSHGRALGTRSFTVAAGSTALVRIRLGRSARSRLALRGRLRIRVAITLRDAAGNAATAGYRFTLLAPRRP